MQIELGFLGAAGNVTGSCYLLTVGNTRVLVDCGLYQERKLLSRNWDPFPVRPDTLDAVLLTHAHLDHCGLLPKLVRDGFHGNIHCTDATAEITRIMLLDSAKLQEEDAEIKRKRHEREGRKGPHPEVPLYTVKDAEAVFPLLAPAPYRKTVQLSNEVEAAFFDAGHVLGSAMVQVKVRRRGGRRTILFSGDVGRWGRPILRDPTIFTEADYILVESTYGDRQHERADSIREDLVGIINTTCRAGGNIVIPSFALERSQEMLYYFSDFLHRGQIPSVPVFMDSPMAISITEVFANHTDLLDSEMNERLRRNNSPFDFPGLHMTRTAEESRMIAEAPGASMIIAGSGMCTGGRIKHHLVTNISRPESTILFVGYQAVDTLGRQIVDGARSVRILGQMYTVAATIKQVQGFYSHADKDELCRWLSGLKNSPRHVFITHGEHEEAEGFQGFLREKTGWKTSVPVYGDSVTLE